MVIDKKSIKIFGDPCCIQTVYYGVTNKKVFISSHENLIGDILGLKRDSYVEKLCNYKFFHLFGSSLPGDISQFVELKRLVPNHYVTINEREINHKRFYFPHTQMIGEEDIVSRVSDLLSSTLCLVAKKWKNPAISLSGGCDSKTTLACARNSYSKFKYFSFISSEEESVDAVAARNICEKLGLEHKTYEIPSDDKAIKNIEEVRSILTRNSGGLVSCNKNDVRKQAFFSEINDFDVEVKSWCSEVGRAYYSKRFAGRKNFGKITPRKCTTLYKVFVHNRRLVLKTDKIFKEYIEKFFSSSEENPLPWQEQFFWEFRMSSWNGNVITGEQRFSHDIFIPYNNRLLLELLLSAPLELRINDIIYSKIREKMDTRINEIGSIVVNVKHTCRRAKLENVYYAIHSKMPW